MAVFRKKLTSGSPMKEITLTCVVLCLMGCAQDKANQSKIKPTTQEKTINLQGCDKSSPNVEKAVEIDSVSVDGPNVTVKASVLGVWGGFFLTSISLPFAAVIVPISELEAGDDAYTKKLKDNLSQKIIASNSCQ